MKKKTEMTLDNTGTTFVLLGIIFIFVSVWAKGWYILRFLITGVLLTLWGYSIWAKIKNGKK